MWSCTEFSKKVTCAFSLHNKSRHSKRSRRSGVYRNSWGNSVFPVIHSTGCRNSYKVLFPVAPKTGIVILMRGPLQLVITEQLPPLSIKKSIVSFSSFTGTSWGCFDALLQFSYSTFFICNCCSQKRSLQFHPPTHSMHNIDTYQICPGDAYGHKLHTFPTKGLNQKKALLQSFVTLPILQILYTKY